MSSPRLTSSPRSTDHSNPIAKHAPIVFPPGWCTYLLICIDGSYYVGLTNNLSQRLQDHSRGKGPTYTKQTKPKLLVWFESHPTRKSAAAREKQLKGWNRAKKHALARAELHLGPTTQNVWLPFD